MFEYKIVEYVDDKPPRKRACINCGHRKLCGINGASDKCELDDHRIFYADLWDAWCRRWCKDRKAEKRWKEYDN